MVENHVMETNKENHQQQQLQKQQQQQQYITFSKIQVAFYMLVFSLHSTKSKINWWNRHSDYRPCLHYQQLTTACLSVCPSVRLTLHYDEKFGEHCDFSWMVTEYILYQLPFSMHDISTDAVYEFKN